MKKIILKAALVAATLFSATASLAGSGVQYFLYINIENTGSGDTVTWSSDNLNFNAAQNTAFFPESSSWAIDISSYKAFPISQPYSNPISFADSVRPLLFNIVKFTDSAHLTLDVRQGGPLGSPVPGNSVGTTGYYDGIDYFLYLNSTGPGYTNPVAAVPEPETYALLLAGLAVVGFAAKRRKPK